MANYNNQGGGRSFGGGGNFKKPSFGKKSWGGDSRGSGPMTLHKAMCAKCGKSCEVPFRPNGKKPVYCKECFGAQGGSPGGGDRFPKKEFSPRPHTRPEFHSAPSGNSDSVTKQLEAVNAKLERLIVAVGVLAGNMASSPKDAKEETLSSVVKKSSKKKIGKK